MIVNHTISSHLAFIYTNTRNSCPSSPFPCLSPQRGGQGGGQGVYINHRSFTTQIRSISKKGGLSLGTHGSADLAIDWDTLDRYPPSPPSPFASPLPPFSPFLPFSRKQGVEGLGGEVGIERVGRKCRVLQSLKVNEKWGIGFGVHVFRV